jgi:hypothetical protein
MARIACPEHAPDFFDRMDRMGGMEELIGFVAAMHRTPQPKPESIL